MRSEAASLRLGSFHSLTLRLEGDAPRIYVDAPESAPAAELAPARCG